MTSLATLARRARRSACHCAIEAVYSSRHVRVDAVSAKLPGDGRRAPTQVMSYSALTAEHAGLQPRIATAERDHATVVDRGPDRPGAQLDDLTERVEADLQVRLERLTPEEHDDMERRLGPRVGSADLTDAWDQVAGAILQRRAIDQLAGQVPPQAAQVASQLARGRHDQASQQFDSQRPIDRLDSLQRPERDLGRDLGRDVGRDLGLCL